MFLEASSDSEGEEKDDCKKANLHIDDWIAFRIDAEVNLYIFLAELSYHFIYELKTTFILIVYSIILLMSVCRCSQTAFLLDRLGRCLKLFVSTDSTCCHEFASQFGLAIFYTQKTPKTSEKGLPSPVFI